MLIIVQPLQKLVIAFAGQQFVSGGQYYPVTNQLIEAIEFGSQWFFIAIIPDSIIPVKKSTPMRKYVEDGVGCDFQIWNVEGEMKRRYGR
jgi:hypothetical protein